MPSAAAGAADPGFVPAPWLANRHLQSIMASSPPRKRVVAQRCRDIITNARSEVLTASDGARLQGFYNRCAGTAEDLVILLHGWEGGAQSHYMLSAAKALHTAGFGVYRLNLRDHGGTHHLNEELFHSCRIDEVVDAVAEIQRLHPARNTYLVGFSLGGNFALRVGVRARSANLQLNKIIAICPVLSPRNTMAALEQGLWIYRQYFLAKWRRSLYRKAEVFPDRYQFGNLKRFPTLTATTDFFVERYTPFPDLLAYLDGYAIIGDVLSELAVPAEIIAASDDPVIPHRDLDQLATSPCLSIELVDSGGHCAFLEGAGLATWMDREIVRRVSAQS